MSKRIVIAHLYPREMNIYGDMGNIIALSRRLEWRGYEVDIRSVEIDEEVVWSEVDLVFGGGGQDSGQLAIGNDLLKHGTTLRLMAREGVPMLTICGLYQLFGRGFTTMEGQEISGIGVFGAHTMGGHTRMIGNIVVDSAWGKLVGFENHSGQTTLEDSQSPLGVVRKGFGNNLTSQCEGAIFGNAIGTYLHGPVLPKNPRLADFLILTALERRYGIKELEPLDDTREMRAAKAAMGRP